MLINLRNALMAGKRLPYDAEVEYLESTGTQWIDTGVYGNSDTVAELTFAMTDSARNDAGIFGARKGYLRDCFVVLRVKASNGAFWMHYGNEGTSANYISTVIGNTTAWHTARLARSWSIDSSTGMAGQYTFTTPTTLKVFAADMSASGRWYAKMRLASLKIYSNNVLVRDYIPVRKGTVGYLYDRVSGKLFGNAGTGDFVVGQDVVPVEYIESHGTEWIDTGVSIDNSAGFVVDYEYAQTNTWLIGGRKSGSEAQCNAWMQSDTNLRIAYGASVANISTTKSRHVLSMINGAVKIDGNTAYNFPSQTFSTTSQILLCNLAVDQNSTPSNIPFIGKMFSCDIYKGGSLAQKHIPVRVGSGSTWEGAMMDTLTRRIYRNAGTGAFTYGNDLKYPIPAS